MDPTEVAQRAARRGPPQRKRAEHGQWVAPAEAVSKLVHESQWNVSDAVREVCRQFGYPAEGAAFNGVRAAYYVIQSRRRTPFEI